MKKNKIIAFSMLILIVVGCVQQKDLDERQLVNSDSNTTVSNIATSKMEIKKELLKGSDYDKIMFSIIENYYPEYEDDNFDQLDEITQTFILIVNMDGQIMNGGIIQFIDNGTGNLFHETIKAAERIKSKTLVEILTKTSGQFPDNKIPKDWDERRNLYDELCDKYITYKSFDELTPDEQKIILKNKEKFEDKTPVNECSYEVKNSWSDAWDKIDSMYYANSNNFNQKLVEYLKMNAKLID
jgi:hypothetical protein